MQLESSRSEHTPQYKKETKRLENNIVETTTMVKFNLFSISIQVKERGQPTRAKSRLQLFRPNPTSVRRNRRKMKMMTKKPLMMTILKTLLMRTTLEGLTSVLTRRQLHQYFIASLGATESMDPCQLCN